MSGTVEQRFRDAIEKGDFRKARYFLNNGVQADKLLEDGIAVIHLLSGIEGDEANQLLKECLDHGFSPNVQSSEGNTPVHVAAIWGLYDNLCALLDVGGNVEIRDCEGLNAIDYANRSDESEAKLCVKLLNEFVHINKPKEPSSTVNQRHKTHEGVCSFDDSLDTSYTANGINTCHRVGRKKSQVWKNRKYEEKIWETNNKQHIYTNIKSKPDSVSVTRSNDYSLSIDAFSKRNPYQESTRDTLAEHCFYPNGAYYIDGRDLMTEDESSLDSLMSGVSSCSFYTADEGHSMIAASALDDKEVSFPKLHPWTASKNNKIDLEDTIVESISNLDIGNYSERLDITSTISIFDSVNATLSDGTVLYDWKEYSILEIPSSSDDSNVSFAIPDSLLAMGCQKLREELLRLGEDPGPIRADTRLLYIRRLARLQSGLTDTKPSDRLKEYLPEVRAVIEGRLLSPEMDPVEESMCVEFTKHNLRSKWREGTEKSSFNYLLLDPRVTQNLPLRSKKMAYEDIFHTFVAAVFYVGKGKRSRPYAHLHEAVNLNKTNRKLQQIRDIWAAGLGVVSLHCFQGVIPVEAYTREACLVEALGLARLTNQKRCDYYGRAKTWSLKKKRQMGLSLIKRALQIFLNEGERQMCQQDLRRS